MPHMEEIARVATLGTEAAPADDPLRPLAARIVAALQLVLDAAEELEQVAALADEEKRDRAFRNFTVALAQQGVRFQHRLNRDLLEYESEVIAREALRDSVLVDEVTEGFEGMEV